jgi:hypothetical protein
LLIKGTTPRRRRTPGSPPADYTAHVEPEIWRRLLSVIIDGLRARPAQTPLLPAALTPGQIDDTMRSWRPHHRV